MSDNEPATRPGGHDLYVITGRGHHGGFPAPNPYVAHAAAEELRRRLPDAGISWRLLPGAPGPAEFCGRLRRMQGLSESRRVAHLFALEPGVAVGQDTVLTALCGEAIRADRLEVLPGVGDGMPCYRCLSFVPLPDAAGRTSADGAPSGGSPEVGVEPVWPPVDADVARRFTEDPGSDTPIARAVWADLADGHLGPPGDVDGRTGARSDELPVT